MFLGRNLRPNTGAEIEQVANSVLKRISKTLGAEIRM